MQTGWAIAVVVVAAATYAQSAPPRCPADRPIDGILGDIHKEQDKKQRSRDPGEIIWTTPPTFPEPAPRVEKPTKNKDTSSSDPTPQTPAPEPGPAEKCADAMNLALQAAHDVEVGDYYFRRQKYRGALQRYSDAVEEKPDDLAIHVRLGRVLEKLGQFPQAINEYKAAQKLAGPQKWSDEAKTALTRLQPPTGA